MKQLLLIFALCLGVSCLKAQSAAETLEWLNAKKIEIKYPNSGVGYLDKIEITDEYLKIYKDNGAYTRGEWTKVKDIKKESSYDIKIVYDRSYDGKPGFIQLTIYDTVLREKFIKALKHMAEVKGARLVNDDLF